MGNGNVSLLSNSQAQTFLKDLHNSTALSTRTLANLQEGNKTQRIGQVDNSHLASLLKLHASEKYLASFDPTSDAREKTKFYRQLKASEKKLKEENKKKSDLLRGIGFKVEDLFYEQERDAQPQRKASEDSIPEGGVVYENVLFDQNGNVAMIKQSDVLRSKPDVKNLQNQPAIYESSGFEMNSTKERSNIDKTFTPRGMIVREINPPHATGSQPSMTPPKNPEKRKPPISPIKLVDTPPLISLTEDEKKAQQKAAYAYTKKVQLERDSNFLNVTENDYRNTAAYQSKLLLLN